MPLHSAAHLSTATAISSKATTLGRLFTSIDDEPRTQSGAGGEVLVAQLRDSRPAEVVPRGQDSGGAGREGAGGSPLGTRGCTRRPTQTPEGMEGVSLPPNVPETDSRVRVHPYIPPRPPFPHPSFTHPGGYLKCSPTQHTGTQLSPLDADCQTANETWAGFFATVWKVLDGLSESIYLSCD